MDKLTLLAKENEHPTISNTYYLSQVAMMSLNQNDNDAEIIKILEKLVTLEVGFREEINFNIRLRAMFKLGHMYISKLVDTGDLHYLDLAGRITDEIIDFSKEQKLVPYVIDAKILKSKLLVIESNVDKAISTISETIADAEAYELNYHKETLKEEFEFLFTDKSIWDENLNPSNIKSRVKDSLVLHFLKTKGGSKGAFPDF